jgi:predicted enzyme related to lactoylglutathione lyase
MVEIIEAAYKKIEEKGFKPNGDIRPYPTGGGYFSVNDPDGNFLFVVQS